MGRFAIPRRRRRGDHGEHAPHDCDPLDQTIRLAAGPRAQHVAFALVAKLSVKVALLTAEGKPLREAMTETKPPLQTLQRWIQVIASQDAPADLVAFDHRRAPLPTLATWRESGGFRPGPDTLSLPKKFFGQLDLNTPPPLVVSAFLGGARLASAPVVAGQDEVTLTIALEALQQAQCSVAFRLVDGDGHVITTAGIHFDNSFGMRPNERGEVTIEQLACGRHELTVTAPGCASLGRIVELGPGERADLGELRLVPRKRRGRARSPMPRASRPSRRSARARSNPAMRGTGCRMDPARGSTRTGPSPSTVSARRATSCWRATSAGNTLRSPSSTRAFRRSR